MVDFVGAGSGAVDLITLRGKKLIEEADLIIYTGSLVNPDLLSYAKKDCRIYNSAKLDLKKVINLILDAEEKKLKTVRLHTGDPCLYGAIREQMDILKKEHILYRYTPGVSSFCGAAAALKTEYTLPDVSQTVIITRLEGRTPVPEKEKLSLLAQHGATMVLFLSTGMLAKVKEELLQGSYDKNTPAAIVYKATWPEEKVVRTTINDLEKAAEEANITKTALIVVGNCLGDDYSLSKLYDASFTTEFRDGE